MAIRLPLAPDPLPPVGSMPGAREGRHRITRAHCPPLPPLATELTERALATPHLMVIEHRSHDRPYSAGSLTIYDGTTGIGPLTETLALGWISTPYSGGWKLQTVHRRRHGGAPTLVLLPETPESAIADFFLLMEPR